jgi:superfamily I DNA and/or RNA helicase
LDLRYWIKTTTVTEIKKLYQEKISLNSTLIKVNQNYLLVKQAQEVKEAIKLAGKSIVGLDDETREKKKSLKTAKRLLEREFAKSKRYKSIRELLDTGAESLLMTLKPIWLMSPHAIADNFDIRAMFDVIIYDEASQARVEDAYPSLLRANQYIIFGDDKQMPPSNYFRKQQQDDLPESLLSYLAPKSHSLSLKWHYRSHSSALIEFSNQHFYEGQLHIIPSPAQTSQAIEFNYIENGTFTQSKNILEAEYAISQLKKLLLDGEKSIGIVAFSLEQSQLIEDILEQACKRDPVFAELVNSSYLHHEKGVYQGLFIKNLENVQGDERDFIVISSAYGFDLDGKLRQYYGPLSLMGGERRLNVLLTRAKKKIILISSLMAEDIQSEKDGAIAFKSFIQFAQSNHSAPGKSKNKFITIGETSEALFKAYSNKQWTVYLEDAYNQYCYPELIPNKKTTLE